MKPASFDYLAASTIHETLKALTDLGEEAKILAGGQSLVPLLKLRLARPRYLIDINGVGELSRMEQQGGELHIGALTRHTQLGRTQLVRTSCPLLTEAAAFVGHVAIRNRGTIGGSLCHADPSAELPIAVLAMGGKLRVESTRGVRYIPAQDFFQGLMTVDLASDEILTGVVLPVKGPRTGWSFQEVARQRGHFALVGVAVWLNLDENDFIEQAGVALAGVADMPLKAMSVEEFLTGAPADEETISSAVEHLTGFDPNADLHATQEYREYLMKLLLGRALREAVGRAKGE